MTWSLVLGGAENVYDDMKLAIEAFGEPDMIVAVKDIWMEYPRVDHVATYHVDRIPRELDRRRKLGYADPKCFWTYRGVRIPSFSIEIKAIKTQGGSSGLLGAIVGIEVADRAILAGIPMDGAMPHYHNRKNKKPWSEARLYRPHWEKSMYVLGGKVKSMSGFTRQLLGTPTKEWVLGIAPTGDQDEKHGEGASEAQRIEAEYAALSKVSVRLTNKNAKRARQQELESLRKRRNSRRSQA